jgi:pyridoxal phosphate enzyme (YggS family)
MSEAEAPRDPGAVAERLAALRARMGRAAERAGRAPGDVRLVGVSKGQPAERVVAAARAGLRHIGENYLQEALPRQAAVRAALEGSDATLRWHFVGRIQRNKAKAVVRAFDTIETLDRERLGEALERHAAQAGRRLETLIQVDVSGEPQKGGVAPDALGALLAASAAWPHLRVTGLMAIPAAAADPEASRPAFARLRELATRLREAPGGAELRELSMGMSADFEVAIEEGATIVRIGTALFGPRERGAGGAGMG